MSSPFDPVSEQDVIDLIAAYPLAWLVSVDGSGAQRVPLPLFSEVSENGQLQSLIGHIPLRHPARQSLAAAERVLILFLGPNGYASPSWYPDRTSAPTWLYASADIEAKLNFSRSLTDYSLNELVARMETSHGGDWSTAEMGERYSKLKSRVVGFRADILSVSAKFKFGQDESAGIVSATHDHLQENVVGTWIRRFNADRLDQQGGVRSSLTGKTEQ